MKDAIISLAKELIRIPSVTGEIESSIATLELVKAQLSSFTPLVFSHEQIPSLLYRNKDHTLDFTFILNAHLDVVPGDHEQFHPYEKDGKLFGRGAFDMKTTAAVMIFLFKELSPHLSYPLGLQLVTDEETGGAHGVRYQLEQGLKADFVLTGEGTDFNIIHQAKGSMKIKLTTHGKAAHGAYPWLGDNAIYTMYRVIDILMKAFPTPIEDYWHTTVTVSKIETANMAYNRVPSDCSAILDIRYVPEEEKTIIPTILGLLPPDVSVEIIRGFPPHDTDISHRFINTLQETARTLDMGALRLSKAHGGSDLSVYKEFGIPNGIEFGLKGGGHHSSEEWVDLQSIEPFYQLLKSFLLALDK